MQQMLCSSSGDFKKKSMERRGICISSTVVNAAFMVWKGQLFYRWVKGLWFVCVHAPAANTRP